LGSITKDERERWGCRDIREPSRIEFRRRKKEGEREREKTYVYLGRPSN